MTEVKFDVTNWFNYDCYGRYLNERPLMIELSTLDGVTVEHIDMNAHGNMTVRLNLKIDTDAIVKVDDKDVNVNVSFFGSNNMYYKIETNLSSEDAAQAEQNLNNAIKSGRSVFKVPTIATPDGSPWPSVYQPAIETRDGELLIEMKEALPIFEAALSGKKTDLGEYEFLRDLVPTSKEERIEFFCNVPEEFLISESQADKQKFHIEDWMNYYKAKLDEDDLKDSISEADLSDAVSISFDGETIHTDLESNVSDLVYIENIDDETGADSGYEVEIFADFSYSVNYKIDDIESYIEDFNEALNDAINKEETTFEIRVPFVAGEAYNVDVDVTEIYDDDADEGEVRQAAFEFVRDCLAEPTFEMHHGDHIQPPTDKEVKFICAIPTK